MTSANAITRLADQTFTGQVLSNTVAAQSITLFVLPTSPRLRLGSSGSSIDFWVDGQANQKYVLQSASNLVNWTSLATNVFTSNSGI